MSILDDWLNDSESELEAEDAIWTAFYERNQKKLLVLREAALAEIAEGTTEDMFDDDGGFVL